MTRLCRVQKKNKFNLDCSHMHFHDKPTDTQHHSSDTARSTFGYQAELPPSTGYEPELDYEDNTSNLYVFISSDTVQTSENQFGDEMSQRLSRQEACDVGPEPSRHLVLKRRLPTEEMPHVPDGKRSLARVVGQILS